MKGLKIITKIIWIIITTFLARIVTSSLLIEPFYNDYLSMGFLLLSVFITLLYFSIFWILFFRNKWIKWSFFKQIELKKIYLVFLIIFSVIVSSIIYSFSTVTDLNTWKSDVFIGKTEYKNTKYNFHLTYPEGSIFSNAQPGQNSMVRFFLPNRKSIGGDEENIGVFVFPLSTEDKLSYTIDDYLNAKKEQNSPYGNVDVEEIKLGGQKGYKVLFTSNYTAQEGKKTREASYFTIRNGLIYDINYFPVINEHLKNIDIIVNSFEFTD